MLIDAALIALSAFGIVYGIIWLVFMFSWNFSNEQIRKADFLDKYIVPSYRQLTITYGTCAESFRLIGNQEGYEECLYQVKRVRCMADTYECRSRQLRKKKRVWTLNAKRYLDMIELTPQKCLHGFCADEFKYRDTY